MSELGRQTSLNQPDCEAQTCKIQSAKKTRDTQTHDDPQQPADVVARGTAQSVQRIAQRIGTRRLALGLGACGNGAGLCIELALHDCPRMPGGDWAAGLQ